MAAWGMRSERAVVALAFVAGLALAASPSATAAETGLVPAGAAQTDAPNASAPGNDTPGQGPKAGHVKAEKAAKDNAGRGNSPAAKLCKKGGWESLARSDDPSSPFVNQGSCIRYVVKGGVVVDVAS